MTDKSDETMTKQSKTTFSNEEEGLEILYVEDTALIARRTKRELLELGYKSIDHCKTWTEAEGKLSEQRSTYDAAILDIKLDGSPLDGIDVAGILYARYSMPILVVTSFSDDRTLLRLEAIPTAGYIMKPATGVQIDASLRRLLTINGHSAFAKTPIEKPRGEKLEDQRLDAPLINFRAAHAEKFEFKKLLYMEADGGQVLLHTTEGKAMPLSMGMDKAIKYFGRDDLIRVHKSYAVPYHAIKKVAHKYVELIDGKTKVKVGDRYREGLR